MTWGDDNPGAFTIMVAVIVVVLGGVGLSIVVDHRFSLSMASVQLKREIDSDAEVIERLKGSCRIEARKLSEMEPLRQSEWEAYEATRSERLEIGGRRTALSAELAKLRKEVSELEVEFSNYRRQYRDAARAAAVGESLGKIRVNSGRVYYQVVVSRVTDVGLEIRHENGFARLHAPDLDPSFQERFQWNDEERRAKLAEERAFRESAGRFPTGATEPRFQEAAAVFRKPRISRTGVRDLDAKKAGAKVIHLKFKVEQLRADYDDAISAVARGRNVPESGRLESWAERAVRLRMELGKAETELSAAERLLAVMSPGDPLLKPSASQP